MNFSAKEGPTKIHTREYTTGWHSALFAILRANFKKSLGPTELPHIPWRISLRFVPRSTVSLQAPPCSALLRHRRHRSTAQPSVRVGLEPRGPWPRCHSCRRRVSPIGAATSAGSAEARRDGAERVCGTWRGQTRMEFGAENERKKQEGTGVNGVCWGDLFLAWVSRFRHGCRKEP